MPVWVLIFYALAAARLTGLITTDDLTDPARTALLHRLGDNRLHLLLAKLITCQWCASIWVAAIVAPIAWWQPTNPWFAVPALALAMSQVTGAMSDLGRG